MAAKNVNFKWYKYVDNIGGEWSIKVSKLVGDDVAFDFGAWDSTKPVIAQTGPNRARTISWVDPNTGRMTKTPVGTNSATNWTTPTTFTGYGKDTTTDIVYSFYARYEERLRSGHTIVSKPEPA